MMDHVRIVVPPIPIENGASVFVACKRYPCEGTLGSSIRSTLALEVEAAYTKSMRIVGEKNRSEIELDPVKAYRRGRALDAMLRGAAPPITRGVARGTHGFFNRLDAERQLQMARALNTA